MRPAPPGGRPAGGGWEPAPWEEDGILPQPEGRAQALPPEPSAALPHRKPGVRPVPPKACLGLPVERRASPCPHPRSPSLPHPRAFPPRSSMPSSSTLHVYCLKVGGQNTLETPRGERKVTPLLEIATENISAYFLPGFFLHTCFGALNRDPQAGPRTLALLGKGPQSHLHPTVHWGSARTDTRGSRGHKLGRVGCEASTGPPGQRREAGTRQGHGDGSARPAPPGSQCLRRTAWSAAGVGGTAGR